MRYKALSACGVRQLPYYEGTGRGAYICEICEKAHEMFTETFEMRLESLNWTKC